MKIYITSDIEGSCGYTIHEEGHKGTPNYPYFANQMALEAAACARGAHNAGADSILIHDAHDTARNIDPRLLPDYVDLMRRSYGDPYAMVSGMQLDKYDAFMMTGFHSWAGSKHLPASHTFTLNTTHLSVNDLPLSEFLFDTYSAAYLGVPTPFISGDENICEFAETVVPGITTVKAVKGIGCGSISRHPDVVIKEIEENAEKALSGNYKACIPNLPKHFRFVVSFKDHMDADFNSFYPGIERVDDLTLAYEADDWYDILLMVHFVLDK